MNRAYQFLEYLPKVVALYGYGSSFTEQGYTNKEKENAMDDYLAIVEDTKEFHLENFDLNSAFYTPSSISYFLNTSLEKQKMGTSVSFLASSQYPFLKKPFKIGIVSKEAFLEELNSWRSLALVGRFSKIIVPFKEDEEIKNAIVKNQKNVMLISLLLLEFGKIHTLEELFEQICALSYMGDIRKLGFEDPNKVKKIVQTNYIALREIYAKPNPYFTVLNQDKIKLRYRNIVKEIPNLPKNIYEVILNNQESITSLKDVQMYIRKYIKRCNQKNTILLAYKGFRIIGFHASLQYALEKSKKFQKGKTLQKTR